MYKKQKKNKLSRKNKSYSLECSPLYRLNSIDRLANLIGVSVKKLEQLAKAPPFSCSTILDKKKKPRNIACPKGGLAHVHQRIGSFLARIIQPDYMYSCVKGRSSMTNALAHLNYDPHLKVDLKDYYSSIKRAAVFYMFKEQFEMSRRLSGLLANLCTFQNEVPTGSQLSQLLAAFASRPLFDRLNNFAVSQGCLMTVIVDDINFSGPSVCQEFKKKVERIILESGFCQNKRKTWLYQGDRPKVVNGVVINMGSAVVPNKQRRRIHELRSDCDKGGSASKTTLRGLLNAYGLINGKFKEYAKFYK